MLKDYMMRPDANTTTVAPPSFMTHYLPISSRGVLLLLMIGLCPGHSSDRQPPATPDGQEAQSETEDRACDRQWGGWELQQLTANNDGRAGKRGNRIQLGAQYGRDLRHEDVAQHATSDPGEHPQQHCGDRVESEGDGLERAGDREQAQPGR